MIAPDDRGLLLGDGLFETLLAIDGRLQAFESHLARLLAGCVTLGLPCPDRAAILSKGQSALVEAGLQSGLAAVRVTWTAGSGGRGLDRPASLQPELLVSAVAYQRPTTPAQVFVSSVRRNANSPTSRLKTLSYLDNVLARREALAAGCDEALMCNTEGLICCGAASNLFWMTNGVLQTPELTCGVLPGIARQLVIDQARADGVSVVLSRADPSVLFSADSLFLTNSLMGARPISLVIDPSRHTYAPPMVGLAVASRERAEFHRADEDADNSSDPS